MKAATPLAPAATRDARRFKSSMPDGMPFTIRKHPSAGAISYLENSAMTGCVPGSA
jgi:hypothetical protein